MKSTNTTNSNKQFLGPITHTDTSIFRPMVTLTVGVGGGGCYRFFRNFGRSIHWICPELSVFPAENPRSASVLLSQNFTLLLEPLGHRSRNAGSGAGSLSSCPEVTGCYYVCRSWRQETVRFNGTKARRLMASYTGTVRATSALVIE